MLSESEELGEMLEEPLHKQTIANLIDSIDFVVRITSTRRKTKPNLRKV